MKCRHPHNLASLRRQVALMAHVRDTVAQEPEEYALQWMHTLVDLTDKLLKELGEAEREACTEARTVWPTTEPAEHDGPGDCAIVHGPRGPTSPRNRVEDGRERHGPRSVLCHDIRGIRGGRSDHPPCDRLRHRNSGVPMNAAEYRDLAWRLKVAEMHCTEDGRRVFATDRVASALRSAAEMREALDAATETIAIQDKMIAARMAEEL